MRRFLGVVFLTLLGSGVPVFGVFVLACVTDTAVISCRCPRVFTSRRRSREAALKDNLSSLRSAIDNFQADKGRYPASLEELVPNYIRRIPKDPFTNREEWTIVRESGGVGEGGVIDVISAADGKTCDGVAFKDL